MTNSKWKIFISKAKADYYKIGSVSCPAFGGEKVYFDERGFNHLMMKKGSYRSETEQSRKFRLLKEAPLIIKNAHTHSNYYKNIREKTTAHFWSLKYQRKNKIIIVVIRQIDNNDKHFLSIMDKIITKSAQTP